MTLGPRYPHRMTVFHPTGRDPWGVPQGVTTANVPCRISYGNRLVRNREGEQVVSVAMVETRHPVEVGDIITLEGQEQGLTVIQMFRIDDLGGRESHREVYL